MNERIVCAANRTPSGILFIGARHWDIEMHAQRKRINYHEKTDGICEQGFLTNRLRFVSRSEAWKIAEAENQILRRTGGDTIGGGTLFSENLY